MVTAALYLALLQGGGPPPTITPKIATAREWVVRLARQMGDSIWPGFRPDTIPVLYVVPGQGTLLLGWPGTLPSGFLPIAGLEGSGWQASADPSAASTSTELAGHATAQVVVNDSMSVAFLVGTTTHEAFHVFERASQQIGKRFGQAENSFLVSQYPVFDSTNETGVALEGRILQAAVQAPAKARKRTLVREFLAVREARQRALGAELADFEQRAELNEGLAEYTLVRAVQLAARQGDFSDKQAATKLLTGKIAELGSLTENVTQSLRLRFYVTGPALGLLLDALEGPKWKTRLVADDLTVQDALADATGYRAQELALRRQADTSFGIDKLRTAADSNVHRLRAIRKTQVDSILAAPGVQLVVVVDRFIGLCGIDPQNLLQVDGNVLLHTRWLRACVGDALQATFNTPVVLDQSAHVLRAVVGADSTVKVTATAPDEVQIESPLVSLHAKHAEVSRDGRVLTVKIKS